MSERAKQVNCVIYFVHRNRAFLLSSSNARWSPRRNYFYEMRKKQTKKNCFQLCAQANTPMEYNCPIRTGIWTSVCACARPTMMKKKKKQNFIQQTQNNEWNKMITYRLTKRDYRCTHTHHVHSYCAHTPHSLTYDSLFSKWQRREKCIDEERFTIRNINAEHRMNCQPTQALTASCAHRSIQFTIVVSVCILCSFV